MPPPLPAAAHSPTQNGARVACAQTWPTGGGSLWGEAGGLQARSRGSPTGRPAGAPAQPGFWRQRPSQGHSLPCSATYLVGEAQELKVPERSSRASPGLRPPAPPPPSLSPCALEAAGLEEVPPCEPPGDSGRLLAGGRAGPVARRWGWPSGGGHGCCGSRGLWAAGVRLAGGAWPAATWLLRRFVAGHCPAARPASGPLRPLLTLPLFSFF